MDEEITKEFRMAILDMIKEIQAKVDMMHKMLAEYTRDKTSSVELLARANDLRYAAQVLVCLRFWQSINYDVSSGFL